MSQGDAWPRGWLYCGGQVGGLLAEQAGPTTRLLLPWPKHHCRQRVLKALHGRHAPASAHQPHHPCARPPPCAQAAVTPPPPRFLLPVRHLCCRYAVGGSAAASPAASKAGSTMGGLHADGDWEVTSRQPSDVRSPGDQLAVPPLDADDA